MKKNSELKKHILPFLILIFLISAVCFLVYKAQFRLELHKPVQYVMMTNHKANSEIILSEESPSASEIFSCVIPELKEFNIKGKIYQPSSKVRLFITLTDADTGKIYYQNTIKARAMKTSSDYKNITCTLPEVFTDSENHQLCLTLQLEQAGNATVHIQTNQKQALVTSFNGDTSVHSNMIYSLIYSDNSFMTVFYIVLCIALLLFVTMLYNLIIVKNLTIEHFFVPAALFLGLIFQCLVTVHGVPDESTHLDTAYKYSNQMLFIKEPEEPYTIYKRQCDAQLSDMMANGLESNSYYQLLFHTFERPDNTSLITVSYVDGTNLVPGFVYFPAALGITIGRLLGLSAMLTFQLGRIFNLIAFVLLVQAAIMITPYWKNLFGVLGLLPITMQQAASASYDAIINGVIFLFIAQCLFCKKQTKYRKRELLLTGVLALFVAVVKGGVYLPLLLLLPLCINHKHHALHPQKHLKQILVFLIGFVLLGTITLLKFAPVFQAFLDTDTSIDLENTLYTIPYVLRNPLNTIYILWNTLMDGGDGILRGLLGGMLSWLDLKMNWCFLIIFLISILLLVNVKNDNQKLGPKTRIVLSISSCLSILLIMFSMLIGYTTMKWDSIQGLQGRYFLPLAPVIFSLFTTDMVSVTHIQCRRIWMVFLTTEIALILQMTTMIL